jgi:ATP-dependent Lhr-like helicase
VTKGETIISKWFESKQWTAAKFQKETMNAYLNGYSGLLNAPTGTGKTYAVFLPAVAEYLNEKQQKQKGVRVLWITPLRALTKDILRNLQIACNEMSIPWTIGTRTGDMSTKERALQKAQMPDVLLITPESLHLLIAQKNHAALFNHLALIVVDEWHELLATKRGVQTELALAHLRSLRTAVKVWGITATIGNPYEAMDVLSGVSSSSKQVFIKSDIIKKTEVISILPDKVERLPWAGHLGINLLDKVMPVILASKTTLLFTNTRSQTEIWYRSIMEKHPELAGLVALHHGSLDREIRNWVEENLHLEKLKLVICTSSLDLGVDFRPVDTVIQVGSPKSIARFMQRAGRSGHSPGETSHIYFVPTHSLELIEAVSLRKGVSLNIREERNPVTNAFDVLAQYMITLAVGDGFREEELFHEIKSVYTYREITRKQWKWLLDFITTGGSTLENYDEFRKVEREGDLYIVRNRQTAMRHRLSMGTIVSDASIRIKYLSGKYLGSIEEHFIARMKPGDVFSFAGMNLEYIRIKDMDVQVRKASGSKGAIPRWAGGRVPLSSQLSAFIRERLDTAFSDTEPEMKKIHPVLLLQKERSMIPRSDQLLIEQCEMEDGHHLFIFPFEGRLVHEGMAALTAYRISRIKAVTFSMAMNDYGFELLSEEPVYIKNILQQTDIFTTENLLDDIMHSVNATEMAKRKFREIAAIAGLIFQGYPGKSIKTRHVQASSSLLFDVIREHEPQHLLIQQAYQESLDQQLEEKRLRTALERIATQEIMIRYTESPTPFAFPILVDRLREQLSSEKIEDRVRKLIDQYR